MKRVNLQTQILQVLQDNLKVNGSFMTISDIAESVFGNGYVKKTSYIHDQMIRERMGYVRELADANGLLIIPKRKPTKEDNNKKFLIQGYKIAVVGFDDQYVFDELMYKQLNGQSRTESFRNLLNKAHDKGMISGEKFNQLNA
jgi:mannitol/fructose-specific phosphotransferase system IIA component (Ntr-type)